MTYNELLDSLINKKREQLEKTPRELVEQIAKETLNNNSDEQRKSFSKRKHREPDICDIVAELKEDYPFIGIMIHGY